jgi:hypothetical protein
MAKIFIIYIIVEDKNIFSVPHGNIQNICI